MNKLKEILTNALYGMARSYENKKFIPSLIVKLAMALASAIITAFFANTLFSRNNTVNQIFAALFFYFLITAVSKLISEIKRGGIGKRLKNTICNMVMLKPQSLWFFIAAIIISLVLPYTFVLSLALLLFVSAVSNKNSMLLSIKNAVTKGENFEKSGKGLAAFTSGLIACGLIICILANLSVPTLYGVIDGSNPKNNTSQTDSDYKDGNLKTDLPSDTGNASGGAVSSQGSSDVVVSVDTNINEAAQMLTDMLIKYAGNDKKSFEKLFRNTESSVIDQYFNTSYDKFKEHTNSLIAISAQDDYAECVWFTALYYSIPDDYPTEREKSVYLSTIMTRADDGWKIEWNDNVRSRLQSYYDNAGFSYRCLDARNSGYAWAKFFITFDIYNQMIYYDNAVMCKMTEMYMDENNNVQITLYISNGTNSDIGLTGVDITVSDDGRQLFSKNFDIDLFVDKHNVSIYELTVPSEEIDFTTWNNPGITDFKFSYKNIDY